MEARPANSGSGLQLSTAHFSTTAAAAWHVLGLLLSHGRPARSSELATISESTPEFIQFLCSIPDSPLRFEKNHFVTFSPIGVATAAKLCAHSDVIARYLDLPQIVPRLFSTVRSDEIVRTNCRKRKGSTFEIENFPLTKKKISFMDLDEEENLNQLQNLGGFQNSTQTPSSSSSILECDSQKLENIIFNPAMFTKPSFYHLSLPPHIMENAEWSKICGDISNLINSSKVELDEHMIVPHEDNEVVMQGCATLIEDDNGKRKKVWPHDSGRYRGHREDQPMAITFTDKTEVDMPEKILRELREANIEALFSARHRNGSHLKSQDDKPNVTKISSSTKPDLKDETSDIKGDIGPNMESCKSLPQKEPLQCKKYKKLNMEKQQLKLNCDLNVHTDKMESSMEEKKRASSTSNHIEKKTFPDFESFIIEEEEGSGGYGTVFRARRKADGVIFAIKCPHVNANRNYVINEMKMLERLRGKHFVIRYAGSFKSGSSDCLVLEHVEHDRPESLKREIDIIHLQWYGYCLFKALAGLHKQGIVHRDIKPGNFLYSRKANKGYLIDFNLALDMRKKYGTFDNSKSGRDPVSDPWTSSLPPAKSKKIMNTRFPESIKGDPGKVLKSILPPGNLKKRVDKAKILTDGSSRNSIKSQGGDGSGITSAKDVTSNKTKLAERFREPIPSQGRRELLSLVQEALQVDNRDSVTASLSKRKRVAASPGDAESFFLYPTPMPLQSNGMSIRGSGLLKSKGDGKPRQEGPCVGTKGFKAPEVLFRSLHQGPKADIWSAGVTLLYLMIGRSPFTGDSDQSMKEIAKLRGSEDLWEVAKLHNHESLFPKDLLDVKYLPRTKLREWCVRNTRRPDFLESIPRSLFDLVDKCLIVNPRHRISAEEALSHDFFRPAPDALKKEKVAKEKNGQLGS